MDGSNFPFARLYSLRSAVITCITFSLVGVSVVFLVHLLVCLKEIKIIIERLIDCNY